MLASLSYDSGINFCFKEPYGQARHSLAGLLHPKQTVWRAACGQWNREQEGISGYLGETNSASVGKQMMKPGSRLSRVPHDSCSGLVDTIIRKATYGCLLCAKCHLHSLSVAEIGFPSEKNKLDPITEFQ